MLFAVAGTFISTLLFGLATYFLVLIHVVHRSHLGTAPFVECMLYGAPALAGPAAGIALAAELQCT